MTKAEMDALKASLLRGLRTTPADGDDAFDRHVLLAARIHQAAKLNQTVTGEGKGWVEFFTSYFPSDRNSADDAKLLWTDWRVGLLKDGTPLKGVAITHGQRSLHWRIDMHGALVIDLESMWDNFEYAIDQFVAALADDPQLAEIVLRRWEERTWTVRPFQLIPQMPIKAGSRFTGLIPSGSTMAVTASNPPPTKT